MLSKFVKLIIAFLFSMTKIYAQSDNLLQSLPSNSYEEKYKTMYPGLNYFYNSHSQIHDYSNNWDFDGDGKKDSLFFVGNGGVHLYFYLQLWLSSNKKTYIFPFLAIDFPFLEKEVKMNNEGKPDILPQFVVADFDSDKLPEIYINLDKKTEIPREWKRKGLSSHQIIVDYSKGKLELKNY